MAFAANEPYLHCGEMLVAAHLERCCIDEVAIARFLKHTPRLRVLNYSHLTGSNSDHLDWNSCEFVNAIGREMGDHLEELYIVIDEFRGSISPGDASMRFQRLDLLRFPLEIPLCNITAQAASRVITSNGNFTTSTQTNLSYLSVTLYLLQSLNYG